MSETDTKPKADVPPDAFSGEQKRYLEGLVSGCRVYTPDAADEDERVDSGGLPVVKKNTPARTVATSVLQSTSDTDH